MTACALIRGFLAKHRERSWWIPYSFFAFFGVVLAVNGIMLYFALSSWTGLDTARPYEHGLDMNQEIAEARAQAALGWQAELVVEQTGPLTSGLKLQLRDREGLPIDQASVSALFRRPTQKALDREVILERRDIGLYRSSVELPDPGIWDLRLDIDHPRGKLRLDRRIVLK